MIKREIQPDMNAFPEQLHAYLQGGKVYDSSCGAEAAVFYCDAGYYVKIASAGMLAREAQMAQLFARMGLGVKVECYLSGQKDYLVTRSAEGEDLTHMRSDPLRLCQILAQALQKLHSQPAEGVDESCNWQHYRQVAEGKYRCFDPAAMLGRMGVHSEQEALRLIRTDAHLLECTTLIHGDACLPNVIAKDGCFSTLIDLGTAGMGDRHMDLYWALWSLEFNLKTDRYGDAFLSAYGMEKVDPRRLRVVAALEAFE